MLGIHLASYDITIAAAMVRDHRGHCDAIATMSIIHRKGYDNGAFLGVVARDEPVTTDTMTSST